MKLQQRLYDTDPAKGSKNDLKQNINNLKQEFDDLKQKLTKLQEVTKEDKRLLQNLQKQYDKQKATIILLEKKVGNTISSNELNTKLTQHDKEAKILGDNISDI